MNSATSTEPRIRLLRELNGLPQPGFTTPDTSQFELRAYEGLIEDGFARGDVVPGHTGIAIATIGNLEITDDGRRFLEDEQLSARVSRSLKMFWRVILPTVVAIAGLVLSYCEFRRPTASQTTPVTQPPVVTPSRATPHLPATHKVPTPVLVLPNATPSSSTPAQATPKP